MASSSSKSKSTQKKPPSGWHKPFMAFLEPRQVLWNKAKHYAAKHVFLEESRTAMQEWAPTAGVHVEALLPEAHILKRYLASYHTSCQPKAGQPGKKAKKLTLPKKIKSKYLAHNIIKVMFEPEVQAEISRLYEDDEQKRMKFQYANKAVQNVEKQLNKEELLSVAKMKKAWETGQGMSELQKRMHNEAKIAALANQFITVIKQKFNTQVFMQVGFPDRSGDVNLTIFETTPPEPHKKYSKTAAWKVSSKFDGFRDRVTDIYGTGDNDNNTAPAAGGFQDLVYEIPVPHVGDEEVANDACLMPMLTSYSLIWPLVKLRPAWRSYVNKVWYFQTGRSSGGAQPWASLEANAPGVVTLAEGVYVKWTDPSRIQQKEMVKTWKSVVQAQLQGVGEDKQFTFPFEFYKDSVDDAPRRKRSVYDNVLEEDNHKKAKKAAVAMLDSAMADDEDEDEDDDEDEAEAGGLEEGPSRSGRRKKVTSKATVEMSEDEEPPAKKSKSNKGKEKADQNLETSSDSDPDLAEMAKEYGGAAKAEGSDDSSEEHSSESDIVTVKTTKAGPKKRSKVPAKKSASKPTEKAATSKSSRSATMADTPGAERLASASAASRTSESAKSKLVVPAEAKQMAAATSKASQPAASKPSNPATSKAPESAQWKQSVPAASKPSGSKGSGSGTLKPLGSAALKLSGSATLKASAGQANSGCAMAVKQPTAAKRLPSGSGSDSKETRDSVTRELSIPPISTLPGTQESGTTASGLGGIGLSLTAADKAKAGIGMEMPCILLTGEWLQDKEYLADYEIFTLEDSSYWVPAFYSAQPEPEDGSPAEALLATKQLSFVRGLSIEPSFMDMLPRADMAFIKYGSFRKDIPWFLRWLNPLKEMPNELCEMDLESFWKMVDQILHLAKESGFIHHSQLLTVGLILQELQRAVSDSEPVVSPMALTQQHYEYLIQEVKTTSAKVVQVVDECLPTFRNQAPPDKNGHIFGPDMLGEDAEKGSPLEAAKGKRTAAMNYLKSLSSLEVYLHAANHTNKSKIDQGPWCEDIVPSLSWVRPTYYAGPQIHQSSEGLRTIISTMCVSAKALCAGKEIPHPYVLAFGLALRDINAAVTTAAGGACEPPFWVFSNLGQADLDFVVSELQGLLKRTGHPAYTVDGGRRGTRTRKASA